MEKSNEKALVDRLTRGDEDAFSQLYLLHVRKLTYYIRSTVRSSVFASDLVHDTFIKVWENRRNIDPDLPFAPYLFTIGKRVLLNFLKRARHESFIIAEIARHTRQEENLTEQRQTQKDNKQLFQQAVDALSPAVKAVFVRCHMEGKSHREAAQELQLSPSTVNKHMIKATRLIREYIEMHSGLALLLISIAALPLEQVLHSA